MAIKDYPLVVTRMLWMKYELHVDRLNQKAWDEHWERKRKQRLSKERSDRKALRAWKSLPWFIRMFTPHPNKAIYYEDIPPFQFPTLTEKSIEGYYTWLSKRGDK